MKKLILFVFTLIAICTLQNISLAQPTGVIYGVPPIDSFSFTFASNDSLHNYRGYIIDTSRNDSTNTALWEIGNTSKYFFSDTDTVRGIMTDTINEYPVNANSWFTIKLFQQTGVIVSFWHKYQTSAGHDGGIVEFSLDTGLTWQNMLGDCNVDSSFGNLPGVLTANFYGVYDTLLSGEQAFSGTSNGWIKSQFQFMPPPPEKLSGGQQSCFLHNIIVRFRFKSDSIPDTLDGWIIGRINIEQDTYLGSVAKVKKSFLNIYPNPSFDASFDFPFLASEQNYRIEIINAMGARVLNLPYTHNINLRTFAKGLYFYKVSDGTEYYSGSLISE